MGKVSRTLLLSIAQRTEIFWFSFFETGIIREVEMRSMSENSGKEHRITKLMVTMNE